MKKINVRLDFIWDDIDDVEEFILTVPNKTTIEDIKNVLEYIHNYLDTEDRTETYDNNGRNPETLIIYACEEHGWMWEKFKFDVNLNFD